MPADHWRRIAELFDEARQREPAGRDAWLRAACDDEATRGEVEAMLRAYDEDPGFLEQPVDSGLAAHAIERQMARTAEGRRIGPYRIVREIGRGGMGVVYEARRDDAEFDRRVAIKVLPAGWDHSTLAERFRFERRVLAGLDHPGIARLLDAGTTEDDVPYFVMELVDGQPIDAWCRERSLTVRQRVELALRVCEAVAHAHQHLVVHRDLKPANILIATDGQPKLLDFGIATVVSDGDGTSAGRTRTGQHSFTPEYASPEQIRGEPVTTASDVYSLGVLVYLLVAGRPPYTLAGLSPLDAMRAICEIDPPPPSNAAPVDASAAVRGDLDRVVLKALRKDPRERYRSVFDLSHDLAAWLDGRMVSATPATTGYRLRTFVSRHRRALAAAAAVTLALAGGAVTTAWQARLARQERDKAENRFREVREFSRSLLFDVHDALRTLPGATEPRRLLLARAVQFLDNLAADAGNDDRLKLELAEGYRRLGQVQGSGLSDNLGDVAGAAASFEKAVALSEEVIARQPASLAAANVATGAYDDLSSALLERGHVDAAERAYARHLALVDQMVQRYVAIPAGQASIASSLVNLGLFRATRRDLAGARSLYERAIAIFDTLPADQRALDEVARSHGFALKRLGAILLADGQIDAGERRYREALALDEALVARHPDNAQYRYDLTFSLSDLGFAAGKRGDTAGAVALWTRALDIREAALAADPKNVRTMLGVVNLHVNLGNTARQERRFDDAIAHWRAALRVRDTLAAQPGSSRSSRLQKAEAQTMLAGCLLDLAGTSSGNRQRVLAAEARTLLAAANAEAGPLAGEDALARAIVGQIALDRPRADRY